VEIESNSMSVV